MARLVGDHGLAPERLCLELMETALFLARLDRDPRDERVGAGMIRLAHELGLDVVAEGVQTAAQLAALRRLECDAAQGFLFARPSDEPLAGGLVAARGARTARGGRA